VPGRFPLFTDENVDGPIIRGLRQRGWDVQHATKELGEKTKDAPIFHLAASLDRVFVSTDKDMLKLAKSWLAAGRPFRIPGHEDLVKIARQRNPHKRLTVPEDVARCITVLCHPATHWMTGNTLHVDGGENVVG
jgi:NAD(P)-dependent dehydrogenase (short-subunit alcohol dehydrogenase family)